MDSSAAFHKRPTLRLGGGDGEISVMWVGDNVAGGCHTEAITPPVIFFSVDVFRDA